MVTRLRFPLRSLIDAPLDAASGALIAAFSPFYYLGVIWVSRASGSAKISGEAVGGMRDRFEAERAAAAGAQLPLIATDEAMPDLSEDDRYHGLPDASEITAIQMEIGCDVFEAVREHRRRKGQGGRKKGALNKRSDDFQRYMLQFGPHPGITLMRVQGRPVEVLAAELGCDKATAQQMQIRAAGELMPYFEGKMPMTVNVNASGDFTLTMVDEAGQPIMDADFEELPLSFADAGEGEEMADFCGVDDGDTGKSE